MSGKDGGHYPATVLGIAAASPSAATPPSRRTSYIGGQPVWHDPTSAPSLQQLACRGCGSCGEVVLLARIYCPIHEKRLDRSLYIFACNKRKCSLTHSGWTVVRNQSYYAEPATAAAVGSSRHGEGKKAATKKESLWDFLSVDSSGGGADDLDDLQALLQERDCALHGSVQATTAAAAVRPSATGSSSSSSGGAGAFCSKSLPLRLVDDALEPSRWWADGEEDGLGHPLSEERIAALLAEYMRCEEDAQIVEVLRRYQEAKQPPGQGGGSGKKSAPAEAESSVAGDDESLDDMTLAEFEFQRTVSLEPRQVLRYCYGGHPLWCSHPPPAQKPPPCAVCGQERVFELQLMPGLLSAIPELSLASDGDEGYAQSVADTFASALLEPSGSAVRPSRQQLDLFMTKLGAGLDFGVVTVWSCPGSCDGGFEESALVQPPSDIMH